MFEDVNNLSIEIFELNSYPDGIEGKHYLIPIENGNLDSDKGIIVFKKSLCSH